MGIERDSIVEVITRFRKRRVSVKNDSFINIEYTTNNRPKMLRWLDSNTTGRIYFGIETLAFELERDAIMFRLGGSKF